jgi:hypothetical protein
MTHRERRRGVRGQTYSRFMFSSRNCAVDDLAAELLRRQAQSRRRPRRALRQRWRDARFRRDLAAAPAEPLMLALTRERVKQIGVS